MPKKISRKYILYVGEIKEWGDSLQQYVAEHKLPWKFVSIVSKSIDKEPLPETDLFREIRIDFNSSTEIKEVIDELGTKLIAAVNRNEREIPNFQKLIPHLPKRLLVPSVDALTKATHKPEMRKAFWKYDKSITPKFEIIDAATKEVTKKIISRLEFPMIIKPAGLAQAVLVQAAHYPEELESILKTVFRKMKKIYKEMKGRGTPKILVEEIIEGDQYSVEAFVDAHGAIYFCPFIKYITSGQKGFDDFFSYEQSTPATISKESIVKAKEVASKGIHALGLKNSVAHIEMIRRDGQWYIIEIGPRIGGFRETMYKKSFDIDLGIQDIRNHLGKTPKIPRVKKGYTSVIKFFSKKEGIITKITGIKKAQLLPSFHEIVQLIHKGEKAVFAKNGGVYVFRITLFSKDKSQLVEDKRKLEKMVNIETTRTRKKKV